MRLGAHVSAAGGLDKAIDRGVEIGCEAIQIFPSPPQGWVFKPASEDLIATFRRKAGEAGISPVFFHGIYLINLGTPKQDNLEKGMDSLIKYLNLAAQLDAVGVIFHPGSHGGAGYDAIFEQTVTSIHHVLRESAEGPWLTLENTAGMGQHIGASFEELGKIVKAVDSPRIKVCLDTQHCFAAGYDVSTKEGVDAMVAEFDRHVGLEELVAVHANDSKRVLGAGVDRHENIGQGYIGLAGFEYIMAHPAFRNVPFYLEVPGMENKGPDKANLDILKEIRGQGRPGRLMRVTTEEFIELVRQAYEGLPPRIKEVLDNVDIAVEDWPGSDELRRSGIKGRHSLLGLYSGVPLVERGSYMPTMPDKITLFQRPAEKACGSPDAMVREIRVTLLHEVGHYLGMSEADLHRLGYG